MYLQEEPMMAEDAAKHEQQVDALAGPEDYWLTITDGARATRRQDITIRRWIATGQLPVRRHTVGLNQRTRQVRASDLAKLTPIIDPTAVITGEEGRLNLMSIPVEQAQLRAGQQQLQQHVAALREHVEQQGQTFRQALTEHRLAFQQHQEQLREALAAQFSQVHEALFGTRTALETMRTEQQQRLAQHGQELERLRQRLAMQSTVSQEAPQRSTDEQVMEQALQTLEEWMTSEFAKLMDQLETLTAQVTASTQSFDHTQQRLQQQEQQIERLMETTARLAEQLARHDQTQQRLLSLLEQPPANRKNEG
jgi:chromosome segregation ATPase